MHAFCSSDPGLAALARHGNSSRSDRRNRGGNRRPTPVSLSGATSRQNLGIALSRIEGIW